MFFARVWEEEIPVAEEEQQWLQVAIEAEAQFEGVGLVGRAAVAEAVTGVGREEDLQQVQGHSEVRPAEMKYITVKPLPSYGYTL